MYDMAVSLVAADPLLPPIVEPTCPHHVDRPVMDHRWGNLTFLHWRYPAATVQALLPPGLHVETFDGDAWVGLVPFEMTATLPRRGPVPWLSRFPETNVRTYVTGPSRTPAVWFLSLDAARLPAVLTARTAYALPYFWSAMSVVTEPLHVTYRSRRRWPGPRGARCDVDIDVGDRIPRAELTDLDHWLTARWRLFASRPSGLRCALAEHEPWPLHRAAVSRLHDDLVTAVGLPRPIGEPIVHFSPGVDVAVSAPFRTPLATEGPGSFAE